MIEQRRQFTSLATVIKTAPWQLPPDMVAGALDGNFARLRDSQTILHFESDKEILGPGRLMAYDVAKRTVTIQLRGEGQVREFTWDEINDFGEANYEQARTMGETLLGAYWEAKVTRKYLERMVANTYARLAPEEVDSFERIADVKEPDVAPVCPLQMPEADVKRHICDIIGNPFAQKDWGGEICDIFCNIQFRHRSVPAAFVLKGKAYATRPLRIADLGKNGDQLVRMFSLPAQVFVVQSNGPIDGTVYNQIQAQVAEKLMTNQPVYYLVLDGVQTARLLRAYGKV